MRISAVHRATVTDDTHRTDGALVLDGAVKLKAQTFTGAARPGWPEPEIGWISPMMGPVIQVPAVGSDVLLVQFDGGELRWANLGLDRTLPAWFSLDMTALVSKGGGRQIVQTEDGTWLGDYAATKHVALWEDVKAYINAHTHIDSMHSPTGTPVIPMTDADGKSDGVYAKG